MIKKATILTFICLLILQTSQAQIINTIAGIGSLGYSGDGGPALSAELNAPSTTALDDLGNVYIVDKENSCVRKVNTAGVITTVAGTGVAGYNGDNIPAIFAQLNTPWGIAIDHTGNIFIADRINYRLRKIDTSGIITTIAGMGIKGFNGDGGLATSAQLNLPIGICFDTSGNLYFSDYAHT